MTQKNSSNLNDDMFEGEKQQPAKEKSKDQCGENGRRGGGGLTSIDHDLSSILRADQYYMYFVPVIFSLFSC